MIRRNAALMPAYNLLLGLIALLGYVAIAAGIHTANSSSTVPLLLTSMFPPWFAGFCLAAIGIGALVPAAIMSIATANLFTRNLYGELVHRSFFSSAMTGGQEAAMAKLVSLAIKLGALAFVLLVRAQFAIELQLLGGVWILQLLPAVVGGLFTRFFHGPGLLCGWFAGMAAGHGDGRLPRTEELDLPAALCRTRLWRVRSIACAGAQSCGRGNRSRCC